MKTSEENFMTAINSLQIQLRWTQEELVQSHNQLSQTQEELAQSHSQLSQTQEELVQSHSQLSQTQEELAQLKIYLKATLSELDELREEMCDFHDRLAASDLEKSILQGQILEERNKRNQIFCRFKALEASMLLQ